MREWAVTLRVTAHSHGYKGYPGGPRESRMLKPTGRSSAESLGQLAATSGAEYSSSTSDIDPSVSPSTPSFTEGSLTSRTDAAIWSVCGVLSATAERSSSSCLSRSLTSPSRITIRAACSPEVASRSPFGTSPAAPADAASDTSESLLSEGCFSFPNHSPKTLRYTTGNPCMSCSPYRQHRRSVSGVSG
jgi:hypothetical protein